MMVDTMSEIRAVMSMTFLMNQKVVLPKAQTSQRNLAHRSGLSPEILGLTWDQHGINKHCGETDSMSNPEISDQANETSCV